MITIYFQGHARTLDIEQGIASGHFDVALSYSGRKQAKEEYTPLYQGVRFDLAFTSDMQRSYETAQIMLTNQNISITKDSRLRECDYGDMTGSPRTEVESLRPNFILESFPNGESYKQVMVRMKSFIKDLKNTTAGATILVVGHYATYIGFEHSIKGIAIVDAMRSQPPIPAKYHI